MSDPDDELVEAAMELIEVLFEDGNSAGAVQLQEQVRSWMSDSDDETVGLD